MNITSVAEHNVYTDPANVIVVAAATATEVLPNEQFNNAGEISQRLIQNVGANRAYYAENTSGAAGIPACNATNLFHGFIEAGSQLDCTSHRQRVCVYSTAGTTISTTIRRRKV